MLTTTAVGLYRSLSLRIVRRLMNLVQWPVYDIGVISPYSFRWYIRLNIIEFE
jgi:hypothetical protein